MSKTSIALAAAAVLTAGCATPASSPEVQSIEVRAGRCFGACPAYHYTVSRTGALVFMGESDTTALGEHERRIAPRAALEAFARLEPWRRRADRGFVFTCDDRITDQPTYHVRWVAVDGATSELTYDRGCISSEGRAFAGTLSGLPGRLGLSDAINSPGR